MAALPPGTRLHIREAANVMTFTDSDDEIIVAAFAVLRSEGISFAMGEFGEWYELGHVEDEIRHLSHRRPVQQIEVLNPDNWQR